jgi:hypothetical protein
MSGGLTSQIVQMFKNSVRNLEKKKGIKKMDHIRSELAF